MANFAKKLDLDNHVLNYRARLKSDYDRKLRAKNFAKLYYLNKEYAKALRYLSEFMSVKNDCPAAYKLQGRIQEAVLERDNAVQSYMKSLELDQSQTDLFDKIMELIPHTNLEPDKVKLWTERLQLAKKEGELLEKIKICSPCSPPGNITMDILNNSLNDSGTPIRHPDLNLTERSDDIHSTPKSGRFASPKALSPYATKVNFEKIEKELIILSQAQEGIVNKVDRLQTDVAKSSSEIIDLIKNLQNNLEKFNIATVSGELNKNLNVIKETVYKHTEMMDKVMKSQVNLEDAIYELTESYGGDAQGDGAVPLNDENKPDTDYEAYNSTDSYPSANPHTSSYPTPKVDSMFNTNSGGVFSRLGEFNPNMFQPLSNQPHHPVSPYVPISPPAAEQNLPATPASQFFQKSISNFQGFNVPELSGQRTTQPSNQTFPTSVASESLNKSGQNDPSKPLAELWKPKGWECSACYTRNDSIAKKCAACETPAPGASPINNTFNFGLPSEPKPFTFMPKTPFDSVKDSPKDSPRNTSNISMGGTSFSSSNTSSNKSTDFSFKLDSNPGSSPSFPMFTPSTVFNTSPPNKPTIQTSLFGNPKSEPPSKEIKPGVSIFGNQNPTFLLKDFASGLQSSDEKSETPKNDNRPDVDLEIVYVKEPKSHQELELAKKYKLPLNFYDYENVKPCPGCRGCDDDTPLDRLTCTQSLNQSSTEPDSKSNLFAAAIATYVPTQTNWEPATKPGWNTTPTPLFAKPNKGGDDDDAFATGEDGGGSENAVFKLPTIQMPDLVEVKTGEEDEEPQFVSRAKIFLFNDKDKEWKERGVGDFKILKNPANNTYRMLLRRDKVLKIACNQRISANMKFEPLENSENALTWAGVDYSDEPNIPGKFCIKFKNKELKNEFYNKIESIKSKLSTISSPSSSRPDNKVTDADNSAGKQPVQSSESSVDSGTNLFAAAIQTYGTAQTNWQTSKTVAWNTTPAPMFQKTNKGEDDDNFATGEDAGGSENAVFKLPTIQMPDLVEVKTGEEDEEPQFVSRAKIFLFNDKDKEWKERGVGEFKILKHPKNNAYRMLLRRDKVLKIACNQRLSTSIKFEPLENSENALTWAGIDYSDVPEKPGKFCIKFKNKELRDEFLEKVEDIKSTLSFAIV